MYGYALYGVSLRSEWRLPWREDANGRLPRVHLMERPRRYFSAAAREADARLPQAQWAQYLPLPDGSEYLRWTGLFEFLVSADGRCIAARPLKDATPDAFHTYLLGQVLSHALIKLGFEPLHATVIEVDGAAVGFVGDSGYGKSTLAASFLRAGHRLVTDDLLILQDTEHGFSSYPGAPRLKLFPEMATPLLGKRVAGVPMNALTSKLVMPLGEAQSVSRPIPLRRLYVLGTSAGRSRCQSVAIRRLSRRQAFVKLVGNTYNRDVIGPERLTRQLLLNARLATTVPLKRLSFQRRLSQLPAVRAAILSDLSRP